MRRAIPASYRVVPFRDGWGVDHDGEVAGSRATKEAALEAAAMAATNAVKNGLEVRLTVAGSREGESALGA